MAELSLRKLKSENFHWSYPGSPDLRKNLQSPGSARPVKTSFSSFNEATVSPQKDKTTFSSPESKPEESQLLRKPGLKIAILGFGAEGSSTYQYLIDQGVEKSQIIIYDAAPDTKLKLPQDVEFCSGPDYINKLNQNQNLDVIFRSPPINPELINSSAITWSATNEFFARCRAKIIAVTGTKGKGTTSSLIHQMLIKSGLKSHLLGNIGLPALAELSKIQASDYVVYEMSSFQLWDIKFSPKIAVILMVTEDHLDVHGSLNNYHQAKLNIVKFQKDANDAAIYFAENKVSTSIATSNKTGIKMPFPNANFAHIAGESIKFNDQIICSIKDVKLIGQHNLQNIMAAISVAKLLNLSSPKIADTIKEFSGLPHRMEPVKNINGLRVYNDSYSSNPSATLAAVRSFKQKSILIVGGFDRSVSFVELAETLKLNQKNFKTIIYGQNKLKVKKAFDEAGYSNYQVSKSKQLEPVINLAMQNLSDEEVLLFSPGSASFDMFKNFEERGTVFKGIINKL
jgi:UDP-N-acetylmuramoylalanine--D-glutamate ligase